MQSSKVIEIDGVFIGAAIRLAEPQGWQFVSADCRTSEADGHIAPTLYDTQMLARRAFVTSRMKASITAKSTITR